MMPSIIQEALLSPGWTRAEITTPFRRRMASGSAVNEVTVSISTVLPASVSHNGRRRKRFEVVGSVSKSRK